MTLDAKQIKPKTAVVVRRLWHSPEIHAFVDHAEVGAKMELTDFLRALVDEVYGDRTRLLMASKADILSRVLVGSDTIIAEMKKTTGHVV